jgi:hypothetical protein
MKCELCHNGFRKDAWELKEVRMAATIDGYEILVTYPADVGSDQWEWRIKNHGIGGRCNSRQAAQVDAENSVKQLKLDKSNG